MLRTPCCWLLVAMPLLLVRAALLDKRIRRDHLTPNESGGGYAEDRRTHCWTRLVVFGRCGCGAIRIALRRRSDIPSELQPLSQQRARPQFHRSLAVRCGGTRGG